MSFRHPSVRVRHGAPHPAGRAARELAALARLAVGCLAVGCGEYDYQLGGSTPPPGSGGSGGSGGAGSTPSPLPGLVGWASVAACGPAGTTGGLAGPTVTVTTASELIAAAGTDDPMTIVVEGELEVGVDDLELGSNKTLRGQPGARLSGRLRLLNATNVVIQDLAIDGGPTTDDEDAVEVSGSSCVWIDHTAIFDGADGNLDIVQGSDLITVSFSRFFYDAKDHDHRFSNLCGADNDDTPGKLNITFHHNLWGEKVTEQMPRVRHGQVHVFDNYYAAPGNNYCIGAGYMARLLVQNNYFEGVTNPIVYKYDEEVEGSGIHTAAIVELGNDYTNATGDHVSGGEAFEPPYAYTLEPAATARARVLAEAGPR